MQPIAQIIQKRQDTLRRRVRASKLSISEIARRADYSRTSLHRWLRGDRDVEPATLDAIAQALSE